MSNCTLLLLAIAAAIANAAPPLTLTATDTSIGRNLETFTTLKLSEPAPAGGLQVVITSSDPSRLILSKAPDVAGAPSIALTVREHFRESPEFWLQALGDSGEVRYTVTAPGVADATGRVTLSPAGIAVLGPLSRAGAPGFTTTPRGWPNKIVLRAVRLTASGDVVESQFVRGGFPVEVQILNSAQEVGDTADHSLTIVPATDSAVTEFKPARPGKTTVTVKAPPGFITPGRLNSVAAEVRSPGIAIAQDITIGENLQVAAALSLGEPAPQEGVDVVLETDSPDKLLLSSDPNEVGKPSLRIHMPAGTVTQTYYLQALTRSGVIKHSASAPGYLSRTGTLVLAPSGVILAPSKHGPPDEAELFRPHTAGSQRNLFVALLSEKEPAALSLFTAYLDPRTRRSADITVQPLRAGLALDVELRNTNPAVAHIASRVRVSAAAERTAVPVKALAVGESVVSVAAPDGFVAASNSTEVQILVRE